MDITIEQFSELMSKVVMMEDAMGQMWTKLDAVNDRTKKHTREIKELEKCAFRPSRKA